MIHYRISDAHLAQELTEGGGIESQVGSEVFVGNEVEHLRRAAEQLAELLFGTKALNLNLPLQYTLQGKGRGFEEGAEWQDTGPSGPASAGREYARMRKL